VSEVKAFGPTALLTPANALTSARLVSAPLFALLVVYRGPTSWLLVVLWAALASTDGLDGHVARWHGTTRSGAFLDPLADKFLVLGALAALADLHYVSVWPVVVIAVREIWMSVYRVYAARHGVSIPARTLAKMKTLVQDVAIGAAFLPPLGGPHPGVCRTLVWVAVGLTVASGLSYLADGRRAMRAEQVPDEIRHASAA
jgi:CDP-diacylglycerol---glycerol-3-phosphate 3-phosphatidyltransferase